MYIFKLSVTPNLVATYFTTWINLRLKFAWLKAFIFKSFVHILERHIQISISNCYEHWYMILRIPFGGSKCVPLCIKRSNGCYYESITNP